MVLPRYMNCSLLLGRNCRIALRGWQPILVDGDWRREGGVWGGWAGMYVCDDCGRPNPGGACACGLYTHGTTKLLLTRQHLRISVRVRRFFERIPLSRSGFSLPPLLDATC